MSKYSSEFKLEVIKYYLDGKGGILSLHCYWQEAILVPRLVRGTSWTSPWATIGIRMKELRLKHGLLMWEHRLKVQRL